MKTKHAFSSGKSDPDVSLGLVKPSDWNADHIGGPQDKIWVPGSNPYGLDDEFDNASIDASWTQVNTSRVTWTEGADVLSVLDQGSDAGQEVHAILKSLSGHSFPLTIETATRYFTPYAYNYIMIGPIFADGTTYGAGTQLWAMPYTSNGVAVSAQISLRRLVNFNTETGSTSNYGNWQWIGGPLYTRLKWESANAFSMWHSVDGVSWINFSSSVGATITPTYAGLAVSTWGGTSPVIGTYEYFRVF